MNRRSNPIRNEILRWVLLGLGGLWLSYPYFLPRQIGTGDALWYHHLLADAVTQFRAGVFPVYVGQSDFSFNGSIYPLRAAPYFQYFAGLLDLVTGRKLGFFALQHLTVILSFLGGAFSAYGALVWIAPDRRWTATALALLYVTCPGVAGLFYAQDLYMSGMTLPWVPLVFASLVRSFDDDALLPRGVLALGLAALWWAHSPIALWATFIAGAGQIVRLFARRPDRVDLKRSGLAAMVFCALAAYPILSVFLLRTRGETIVPYVMDRELLLHWVSGSFPSSLEPLDPNAAGISFLQLGYGLWLVLLASVVAWMLRPPLWAVATLLASAAFLVVLVFPIPGLTPFLWRSFPETLVGMTLYWPMQRLYILIAAAAVVSAQRLVAEFPLERFAVGIAVCSALLGAILWSTHESAKMIEKSRMQADSVEYSRRWDLTENLAVQRHTYGLFARRPSYFTHGVVDPRMEVRLLDPVNGRIVASNYDLGKSGPPLEDFRGAPGSNPGILDLDPPLSLRPGERYLLTFDFARPDTTGVLQIIGDQFYREYSLPESGESKSFGSGPENEKSIAVWTSMPEPETIRLRFIPQGTESKPSDIKAFARYRLQLIGGAKLPIRVESLIPLTAVVDSPKPALLESPRMFVPGYAATVNGSEVAVSKSSEGLVAFLVPAGESRVVLRFVGPPALRLAFWLSAGGWLCAATWFIRRWIGRLRQAIA